MRKTLYLISACALSLSLSCCDGRAAQADDKNVADAASAVLPKSETVQPTQPVADEPVNAAVDTTRIYEQSEVESSAFCSVADAQVPAFLNKYFKYPAIEPVNGRGLCDLVIEKDGTVSDVIIVKGIQPELDKEFIRVFKLMPKFLPAKIGNTAVRSKYRMPIVAMAK